MNQILNAVKAFLTPEFLEEAAKKYDETEIGISKAISCLAPSILLGLGEKSGDSHTIYPIFNALRDFDMGQADFSSRILQNEAPGSPLANQFLATIFGAKTPAITNAIASFSGVKQSTAAALLQVSTPWIMGEISKKIHAENLHAGSLVSYLISEKNAFLSLIPSSVGGLLGMSEISESRFARPERSGAGKWWFWLILLLIGILTGLVIWIGS